MEKQIEAIYDYCDKSNKLVYQVIRYVPKDFRQRRPDGNGGWIWDVDGAKRTLYQLPELIVASPDEPVFFSESEKDADCLIKLGLIASSMCGGAARKPEPDELTPLYRRRVIILAHNDNEGKKFARNWAREINTIGSAWILDLPLLPEKGDVADWLDAGGTASALLEMAETLMAGKVYSEEPTPEAPAAENERLYARTDLGNAEYFRDSMKNKLCYNFHKKNWYYWNGDLWRGDDSGRTMRAAFDAVRNRLEWMKARVLGSEQIDVERKWCHSSQSNSRLINMVSLARYLEPLSDNGHGWDTDAWKLGVENGVLDLRTGQLVKGEPEWKMSLQASIKFDTAAACPQWIKFLEQVFVKPQGGCDSALLCFIQRSLGYSLTGMNDEQVFWLCVGGGTNGKSTFLKTIQNILGQNEYAYNLQFTAMEARSGAGNTFDLAYLDKKRFVTSFETTERSAFNEGRIKALVGGDPITAAAKYENEFTFRPQFKLWLAVNHLPKVFDDSTGFWRRVLIIPFLNQFNELEADKKLEDKLSSESSGILNWMLEGCCEWQRHGLGVPGCVKGATNEYRRDSDILGDFLGAMCVLSEGIFCRTAELYRAYLKWAEEEHVRKNDQMSQSLFARRMGRRFTKRHTAKGNGFEGIGLKNKDPELELGR